MPDFAWGWGFLGRPAGSCLLPEVFKDAGQREESLSPLALTAGVPHFSGKAGFPCRLPLLFLAPVVPGAGTEELGQHLLGVTRTRCSVRPSPPRPQARGGSGGGSEAGCAPLLDARPSSGPGRTWSAAAQRWRGWAPRTCSFARWPRDSGREGRRRGALCALGDAVLTRPGSSSLHFNSWPLWPLHTEPGASRWS